MRPSYMNASEKKSFMRNLQKTGRKYALRSKRDLGKN